MSYSSIAEVAAIAPLFTDDTTRSFTADTQPTLTQVTKFLERISAMIDVLLAENGFSTPVTSTTAKLAIDQLVTEAVAELVRYSNGTGRFFSERIIDNGLSPMRIMNNEFASWIEQHADGLANAGANRTTPALGRIITLDTNDDGTASEPLFQRDDFGFGNSRLGDA